MRVCFSAPGAMCSSAQTGAQKAGMLAFYCTHSARPKRAGTSTPGTDGATGADFQI